MVRCPCLIASSRPSGELVACVQHIGEVNRLQIADGTAGHRGALQRKTFFARRPPELAERRNSAEHLVIDDVDIDNLRLANAGGVLGYRVKHRLHVRIGDYAENVADRRLLLQRLVTFADDPCELCFLSGIGGTAHSVWRSAAL
jgi:hypothetical protein